MPHREDLGLPIGDLLESLLEAPGCGSACYLASGACVSAVVAAATVWLGLRRRPA